MESHLILPLDQKPFLACPLFQAYEEKETVQLSAVEAEGDATRFQALRHVSQRFVFPLVPDEHLSCAVLPTGIVPSKLPYSSE